MADATLPAVLKQLRKSKRLSQLELSLRLEVSQRHISFVESGKAKPSRSLLTSWLNELEAAPMTCNETMLLAGYAPIYSQSNLDAPELNQVRRSLQELLSAHDPVPAMILDESWNVLQFNRGGLWLAVTLMPWLQEFEEGGEINILDLLSHPQGFVPAIQNLEEVGPIMLSILKKEATVKPTIANKVEDFESLLCDRLGQDIAHRSLPMNTPVMTTRYGTKYGELSFFSMFTTFGNPQDITLASLRVEHLFPADESTSKILNTKV